MKNLVIPTLLLVLSACTSTSHLPLLEKNGVLPDTHGVVAVATGRKEGKNIFDNLSFISYHAASISENNEVVEHHFLPAEPPSPQYPFGNLGEGKYGFLHIFELPEGEYRLIGSEGRGYAVLIAGGGAAALFDEGLSTTAISYPFHVKAGQINYLGELLTIDDTLTKQGIEITDQSIRDKATAIEMSDALSDLPFVYAPPKL